MRSCSRGNCVRTSCSPAACLQCGLHRGSGSLPDVTRTREMVRSHAAFPQQRCRESTACVLARSAPLEPSPPGLGAGRVHGKTPKPAARPVRAASRRSKITSPKKLEEKHLHNRVAESDRHPVSQETAGEDSGALRDKTHQPPFLTL